MTVWRRVDPTSRLTDHDAAVPPRATTSAKAQSSVNFVVFEPDWLPEDCTTSTVTLRPELPPGRPEDVTADAVGQNDHTEGNRCSLRTVVDGDDRRIRIKQFCYDWAPPSGGIAGLWHTSDPVPFECGDAVGWLGTDYKGNRGAVVQRRRTQVECSVVEGSFSDDELRRVLDGLTPADPESAAVVRGVPFHRLNYWVRYRYRPPGVSHGLWDHGPERRYDECRRVSRAALSDPTETLPVQPLVPGDDVYTFDSAVAFPDASAVESVFRHRSNGSDHLWLTAAAEDSPMASAMPPDPADQAAETRTVRDRRGTDVHYAALTEEFGGWEAFWAEDGVRYAAWAGPSLELDGEGFLDVVSALTTP